MAFDIEPHILPEEDAFEGIPDSIRELAALALGEKISSDIEISDEEDEEATLYWREETDPAQKVETFLESNAHLFGAVNEAWKDVRVAQQAYITHSSSMTGHLSRKQRRDNAKSLGMMTDPRSTIGYARIESQDTYKKIQTETPVTAATLTEFLATSDELTKTEPNAESLAMLNGFPEALRDFVLQSERLVSTVMGSRLKALLTQGAALAEITELLEDDTTVSFVFEHIKDLAKKGSDSHSEYPGFMELVATHVQQEGSQNVLQTAFQRTAPQYEAYAEEFIARQLEEGANDHKRKELSVAFGVMSLITSLVERDFAIPAEQVQTVFAQHIEAWPPALAGELQLYATSKTNAAWENIKAILEPFVREGRMHVDGVASSVRLPAKTGHNGPQGIRKPVHQTHGLSSGRGKTKSGINFSTTSLEIDHDAILAASEREPISKFGILVNSGRKSERYTYEEVDSLEDLYVLSNLADYAKKYQSDPAVEVALRKALEILTTSPYDAAFTCQRRQGRYTLEYGDESLARIPRRFSAQHLPGLRRGSLATKTRIIYDVISEPGGQRLVLYGAFHKQDVESAIALPRRRV